MGMSGLPSSNAVMCRRLSAYINQVITVGLLPCRTNHHSVVIAAIFMLLIHGIATSLRGNVLKTCSSDLSNEQHCKLKSATSPVTFSCKQCFLSLKKIKSSCHVDESHSRFPQAITNLAMNMDMGTASMATSAMTATATDMTSMASPTGAAGGDMGGMDMMGGCKISVRH